MTQVEKLIKIIMPDLLKYLKMKESGELAQKRLDSHSYTMWNISVMLKYSNFC